MVQSTLARRSVPDHGKHSSRHGHAITRVILHHWADTTMGGANRLQSPNKNTPSANYLIFSNGEIVSQVSEEFRAWTSGSWEADAGSITIEVQNSTRAAEGKGDNDPTSWQVSDAALRSIIALLADIARRYNWGRVADPNLEGHRQFAATACPGGYLWHKLEEIATAANKILANGTNVGKPPATPPTSNKSIHQLADEVLAGLHGNGDERRESLGARYEAVQAEVNRRLGLSKKLPPKAQKSVDQLVDEVLAGVHGSGAARKKSLGKRYREVQDAVNRRLGLTGTPGAPNIQALADAVMRGAYGNGHVRKLKLGRHYDAVMAEVNRRIYGR